ncbi:HlyD family type I secretion periplasmic adaptor subunit [Duganella sp. S19_KUP01_CR8]|uniref:HlyD family type I secretion periplasmic adaptor subunit n=1 Tax=Duganella sp. S19_KUP01_CR8 TaxID=3025502 RepID=UPI002FCD83DA
MKKTEPVSDVISHDVTPLTVDTDPAGYARMGWIMVLVMFVGFLLWAFWAPLDKGSPMSGTVVKESNRKTIQYLQGGTVQDILVKDGDVVKAGQVLVRMNAIPAKAALDITRAQYIGARATEARLQAELAGQKSVGMPPALKEYQDDPRTAAVMALQNQLLLSRQSALQSELGAMDEGMGGLRAQISSVQESRESRKAQQATLKEQLDNMNDLVKDGYVARNRYLEIQRSYQQVTGSIAEDGGSIARAQRQISETQMRKAQRASEYQKEVRSLLADTNKEAESLRGRIDGQNYDLQAVDIKSPVDGVVTGSSLFTRGGVVGSNIKIMEIVPSDDAYVVEGQLPVNLIDKVHVGLPVEMSFAAFNANRTPHIPGEVIQVAADRTVDERTGNAYYKVRARVTPAGAKIIDAKKLVVVSGMPVEVFVKTGERTMISYLFKPIFDRAKTSLTED